MKSKHSVCAIILIVAIVGLILSCSNNPTLENKLEETGYVSFGNAGSRSLSVMYEMEDFDDLYWTYTAKKADGYGQTGQTTSEQPVPPKTDGKGIGDGTVGPFSMGDWDFNLFAYKDAEKTIKVYEGKTPSRVNIIAGDTKNVSVAVSPFGTTGVLNIENAYFHWDSTSGGALPVINLTMDMDKSDEITDQSFDITPVKENGDITFALNETIPVGFYYCKLKATIDTASTPIYETEEFTLRIYGATTTTIFGDITEQTGPNVVFSATKSDNSELAAITGTDVREVSVNATPAGSDTTTVNFGTYNIGTIETTSEDGQTTKVTHVLEVAVSSSDTVDTSDTNRFIVDDGKDAVAALDLNLIKTTEVTDATGNTTTTTEPVTTFGDGNEVTITTYVAKNLFDVKVRYNNGTDTPEEIDPESYDPSTGMLVFKVSHFSEYYVTAKLPEAKIGDVYFTSLKAALDSIAENNPTPITIEILKDITIDQSFKFSTNGKNIKNIIINGNNNKFIASNSYYYSNKPMVDTSICEGIVFNNVTFDGNNKTYSLIGSGKDKTFNNCKFIRSQNAHYYGVSTGYLVFKNCEFDCYLYNVNQSEGGCNVVFEDCILSGWNSFSGTETVSFLRTTFTKTENNGYSIVRTYSDTTFTDCSFTEAFISHEDEYYGSGINPVYKSVAELNNCRVIDSTETKNESTHYSIYDACKPFIELSDPNDMGVCVINGVKENSKYKGGALVGDNSLFNNIIADGYVAELNESNKYYELVEAVAKINNQYYATLESAVIDSNNEDVITLLKDIDLSKTLKITKNITLDMNGKKISNTSDIWNEANGDWSMISVRGSGDLTITGNGTLDAKENDCYAVDVYDENARCTIENGTFNGNLHCAYAYNGTIVINGGKFNIKQLQPDGDRYRMMLNCYDSSYKNGIASFQVSGGEFYKYDPANSYSENPKANFVVAGKTTVQEGEWYKVVDSTSVSV